MAKKNHESESLFSSRGLQLFLITASIPLVALIFVIAAFVWAGPNQYHETAFAGIDHQPVDPNQLRLNGTANEREELFRRPFLEALQARVSPPEPIASPAMLQEQAVVVAEAAVEVAARRAVTEEPSAPAVEPLAGELAEVTPVTSMETPAAAAEKALPSTLASRLAREETLSAPAATEALRALKPPTSEAAALPEAARAAAESITEPAASLGAQSTSELLTELASAAIAPEAPAAGAGAAATEPVTTPPDEAMAIAEEPAPSPAPEPARRAAPAPIAPAPPRLPAPIPTVARIVEPQQAVAPPAAPLLTTGLGGVEQQLLAMQNNERARVGAAPLTLDATLTSIARRRATDMASRGYFSHVSPTGESTGTLVAASGLRYRSAAENIARNDYPDASSASAAMSGFMSSASHRANIVNPSLTRVGIAVVVTGSWKYYALVYLQP